MGFHVVSAETCLHPIELQALSLTFTMISSRLRLAQNMDVGIIDFGSETATTIRGAPWAWSERFCGDWGVLNGRNICRVLGR